MTKHASSGSVASCYLFPFSAMEPSASPEKVMGSQDIEQEFLAAYDAYADAIFRHCYFRSFDRERGKDLMQETFIRVWDYLSKGKTVDNMRAFLYSIANNLIIDEARRKKEMSLEALQEGGFDPGRDELPTIHRTIEYKRALSACDQLGSDYRETIVQRYVKGLSPAEIAEARGESANTVSVRLYRALHQLRGYMSQT